MPAVVNTRPMIKDKADPIKEGSHGLKSVLKNLAQKPKDEINHNAALSDKGEKPVYSDILPNKDETIREKQEKKERQDPNVSRENFQDSRSEAAFYRWIQMRRNLKKLKKEGFELKEKQMGQLLRRAVFSPSSTDSNDPMGVIKALEKDKKIVEIISRQNLSAERIASLLDRNSHFLKLSGFGEIKNRRPDRRKRGLLKILRGNAKLQQNIQRQVNAEKKRPKLFTNLTADLVKKALGNKRL